MRLIVDYKSDQNVPSVTEEFTLSRAAFIKHLAIAGQGYAPRPGKFVRSLGMLLHYRFYLRRQAFYRENRFSQPPDFVYDPTENGQFSNLAGKAIADFLSKKIDKSLYTVNYEAAMRLRGMPIHGSRPDLLAFSRNKTFSIEAKGYTGGSGDMAVHKAQAFSHNIPVNFSVACVSYNIYDRIQCNYHDPVNLEVPFDEDLFRELTKGYYGGLSEFVDDGRFTKYETVINEEEFYEIGIKPSFFEDVIRQNWYYLDFLHHHWRRSKISILIPRNVVELSKTGLSTNLKEFERERSLVFQEPDYEEMYIDNDRVGIRIRLY